MPLSFWGASSRSLVRKSVWLSDALRSFSFREKCITGVLALVAVGSLLFWIVSVYHHITVEVPDYGGSYSEGTVGNPLYINPVLSKANGPDYNLSRLVYSGLLEYAPDGTIRGDIASDWNISEDGKVYTVFLRDNVLWHNGERLTADDVVFTVNTIRDLAYKSPLREPWLNASAVRGADEFTVVFTLDVPRADFLDSLTVGILPKHLWEGIPPENFALHKLNLEPVGAGPYRFERSQKNTQGNVLVLELEAFEEYYAKRPYIETMTFKFYPDRETLTNAYKNKEVLGMSGIDATDWEALGEYRERLDLHSMRIPHYYVAYFNQNKSKSLADKSVREALSLATDRQVLTEIALFDRGEMKTAPFLFATAELVEKETGVEQANRILDEANWSRGEDGVREKDGIRLEFDMLCPDWREFTVSADALRDQWERIGVRANVKVVDVYDLWNNYIKPREYEALVFAHTTTLIPDIYPYWHSSRTKDPGLNLAVYKNDDLDALTEKLRITRDENERQEIERSIANIFTQDVPSLYLFSPEYLYPTDKRLRGIATERVSEDSDRFFDVESWYVKTKRVFEEKGDM
jgi:peptide/nickel transport system substrate-binding protein